MIALALLELGATASECFPKSEARYPHFLLQKGTNGPDYATYSEEMYQSVVGCADYIIAGGHTTNAALNQRSSSAIAVVTKIDLANGAVRWSKTLDNSLQTNHVAGLAL